MDAFLPASDYWWRQFMFGAVLHFIAVTPVVKTDKHAEIFRFGGYSLGVVPVFLREGIFPAIVMLLCLYGFSFALKYFKGFFTK
jgi:hypothetical protein